MYTPTKTKSPEGAQHLTLAFNNTAFNNTVLYV